MLRPLNQRRSNRRPHPIDRRRLLAAEYGPGAGKSSTGSVRIGLVYPNTYRVGMASLGFQITHQVLARAEGVMVERFFMDTLSEGSIESGARLDRCHLIAISSGFELDDPNVLEIIRIAGLPRFAADRVSGALLCMGGVRVAINRLPLYPFIDVFFHGDAERVLPAALERLVDCARAAAGRDAVIDAWHGMPGIEVTAGARMAAGREPDAEGAGLVELCRIGEAAPASSWPRPAQPEALLAEPRSPASPASSHILTPQCEFSDMALLDLARGCPHGCTFCWIGRHSSPFRPRSGRDLYEHIERLSHWTDRFGLVSSAVGAHPEVDPIVRFIVKRGFKLSYSSLRMEQTTPVMLDALVASGQKTATIAPEAGSIRLRRLLGKPLCEEALLEGARRFTAAGIENLKLYFMLGIPTETTEEAMEIARLIECIRQAMLEAARARGRMGGIIVNLGIFVPKPGLPLNQLDPVPWQTVKRRLGRLIRALERIPNTRINASSVEQARAQRVLSMGGGEGAHYLALVVDSGGNWRRANRDWPMLRAFEQEGAGGRGRA